MDFMTFTVTCSPAPKTLQQAAKGRRPVWLNTSWVHRKLARLAKCRLANCELTFSRVHTVNWFKPCGETETCCYFMHGEMRYQVIFTTLGFSTGVDMFCMQHHTIPHLKQEFLNPHIKISRSSVDAKTSVFIATRHLKLHFSHSCLVCIVFSAQLNCVVIR